MNISEDELAIINLQNVGLELNEAKSRGVNFIPIDQYISLYDSYIKLAYDLSTAHDMLDRSFERFDKLNECFVLISSYIEV